MAAIVHFRVDKSNRNVLCDQEGNPIQFLNTEIGSKWFLRNMHIFMISPPSDPSKTDASGEVGGFEQPHQLITHVPFDFWTACCLKSGESVPDEIRVNQGGIEEHMKLQLFNQKRGYKIDCKKCNNRSKYCH